MCIASVNCWRVAEFLASYSRVQIATMDISDGANPLIQPTYIGIILMQIVQGIQTQHKTKAGTNVSRSIRNTSKASTSSKASTADLNKSSVFGSGNLSLESVDKKIASFNW